jgi:hypothetical protein
MPGAQQKDDKDGEEDEMIPGTRWEFCERKKKNHIFLHGDFCITLRLLGWKKTDLIYDMHSSNGALSFLEFDLFR